MNQHRPTRTRVLTVRTGGVGKAVTARVVDKSKSIAIHMARQDVLTERKNSKTGATPAYTAQDSPISPLQAKTAATPLRSYEARQMVLGHGKRLLNSTLIASGGMLHAADGGGSNPEQDTAKVFGRTGTAAAKDTAALARDIITHSKDFITKNDVNVAKQGGAGAPPSASGKDPAVSPSVRTVVEKPIETKAPSYAKSATQATGGTVRTAEQSKALSPMVQTSTQRNALALQRQPAQTAKSKGLSPMAVEARKKAARDAAQKMQRQAAAKNIVAKQTAQKAAQAAAKKSGGVVVKGAAGAGKGVLAMCSLPVLIVVIVIVLVIAIFMIIAMSPLGFFMSDNNEGNEYPISRIVSEITAEWNSELDAKKADYEAQGFETDVLYNQNDNSIGGRYNNWRDVLSLFIASSTNMGDETMLSFDADDYNAIRDLYFRMNTIEVDTYEEYKVVTQYQDGTSKEEIYHSIAEMPTEPDPTPGAVSHIEIVRFADINVTNLSYTAMLGSYPMNVQQKKFLEFLMGAASRSMWQSLDINISEAGGQAGMDIDIILRDLPYGEVGTQIVAAALSKLGTSYGTMDCSALTQYAVGSVGISIPRTAADQAQWAVSNGRAISESTAQPGDLIFWSYESGHAMGRYMNIGHVAVYAGNGMMVESAPSCGGVAYHAVSYQGKGTKVLWARPY